MKPRKPQAVLTLQPGIEHGIWTPVPLPPPKKKLRLRLRDVDKKQARRAIKRNAISFHVIGCSGNHDYLLPQKGVAGAMIRQLETPGIWGGAKDALDASFLFHLGDLIYKGEMPEDSTRNHQPTLYDEQLFTPYAKYDRMIFAIPGNHDGKQHENPAKSAIGHFLGNFCSTLPNEKTDAGKRDRPPGVQPYAYWVLETPVCYIVGLYGNVVNAGQLDDPMAKNAPQYDWLVKALSRIKARKSGKAILLAVHYPPYSGARDFILRGDPNIGPTPRAQKMRHLAEILQSAFKESGVIPDLILSAHAHNYQRLEYEYAGGRIMPCLIVGTGGHAEMEPLTKMPDGKKFASPRLRASAVLPPGFTLPKGDKARLLCYQDQQPGFLRLTVDLNKRKLTGEYFRISCFDGKAKEPPSLFDRFVLDLKKHRMMRS